MEENDKVTFLYKMLPGSTNKSYGINVASLAGLPKSLIERSKQILNKLEEDNNTNNSITLDLFNFDDYDSKPEVVEETTAEKIKKALDEIDVNRISPIEALNILNMLKEI